MAETAKMENALSKNEVTRILDDIEKCVIRMNRSASRMLQCAKELRRVFKWMEDLKDVIKDGDGILAKLQEVKGVLRTDQNVFVDKMRGKWLKNLIDSTGWKQALQNAASYSTDNKEHYLEKLKSLVTFFSADRCKIARTTTEIDNEKDIGVNSKTERTNHIHASNRCFYKAHH